MQRPSYPTETVLSNDITRTVSNHYGHPGFLQKKIQLALKASFIRNNREPLPIVALGGQAGPLQAVLRGRGHRARRPGAARVAGPGAHAGGGEEGRRRGRRRRGHLEQQKVGQCKPDPSTEYNHYMISRVERRFQVKSTGGFYSLNLICFLIEVIVKIERALLNSIQSTSISCVEFSWTTL